MNRIAFIINPVTKRNHVFKQTTVLNYFSEQDYDIRFFETEYHQHALQLTEQAIKEGFKTIVAVGGTGTIHQVLQKIIGKDVSFSIFPTGNGNGFSTYIGLPFKLKSFLKALKENKTKQIDYGEIQFNNSPSKYFLSFFCAGASPLIAKNCEGLAFKYYFPYVTRGYKVLWKYKPKNININFLHLNESKSFYEIFIGNIPSFRGRLINNKYQSIQDGTFSISLLEKVNYKTVLEHGFKLLFDSNDNLYNIADIHQASNVKLFFETKTIVQADFEPFETEGEITIINHKRSLTLILPESIKFI